MEKDFKIGVSEKSGIFMAALVLNLSEADDAMEEWGCKQDIIHPGDTWYFKVVLILVIKVITIYLKLF